MTTHQSVNTLINRLLYIKKSRRFTSTMNGNYPHTIKLIESFAHNFKILEGAIYNFGSKIDEVNTILSKLRVNFTEAQRIVTEPFPQADEFSSKEKRLKTPINEFN